MSDESIKYDALLGVTRQYWLSATPKDSPLRWLVEAWAAWPGTPSKGTPALAEDVGGYPPTDLPASPDDANFSGSPKGVRS